MARQRAATRLLDYAITVFQSSDPSGAALGGQIRDPPPMRRARATA
ncbi:MAG TPA: hypothetical protein VFN42_03680 [Acetobacteraceae bacterium]|nr:hypothetical protein [Acetobacteraceae bacterium]